MREALRQLRAEGAISTGRGRRPRIAAPEPVIAQPTGIVYSLFSAVELRGLSQVSMVRALDVRADGVIAPRLGLEESTPLVYLERLRLLDGEPLALDRVWLPASIGEPLLGVDFRRTGVYDELSRTGITVTGGHETVRAVVPSRAEHRILDLPVPSAAFSVERTASSHGVPDRVAVDRHPRRPVRPHQHARGRHHCCHAGHHPLLGPDPESRPIPPEGRHGARPPA